MELDPDRLNRLGDLGSEDGRRMLAELFDAFVADAAARLSSMRTALDAGDLVRLRALAHEQKGASGMVGATRLAGCFATIELACPDGATAKTTLALIEPALAMLGEEVTRLLHSAGAR